MRTGADRLKKYCFHCAMLTLIVVTMSGCSSIRSRTETQPEDWTVYPGVQRDGSDLLKAFEGNLKGPQWTMAFVVPFLIADTPCSVLLDTVALPYDVYLVSQNNSQENNAVTKEDHRSEMSD